MVAPKPRPGSPGPVRRDRQASHLAVVEAGSKEERLPSLSFTPGPDCVPIDLDRLVATRLLIQASSGGGKSFALRWLLEQTHGRIQQFVLDWEGEFASLRERFA